VTIILAQRDTLIPVMESILRDARAAAAGEGERAVGALEARLKRAGIVSKLDGMLAESNSARRARQVYVMRAFAQLVKELGGPDVEGAKESIPPEPRQRLAELGGAEVGKGTASSTTGGGASDKAGKPGAGGGTAAKTGPDAGGGWIGSDTEGETKTKNFKPVVVEKSLAGDKMQVVDAEVTPVDVKDVVGAVWTKDAKAVVILQKEGLLRRVRVPELVEERQVRIDSPCGSLAVSKEGLVAAVVGMQELWVFDETTLELKRRVTASGVGRAVSGPGSSIAIASAGADGVSLINVATGQTLGQISAADITGQRGVGAGTNLRFNHFAMSPDGRYFFTEGGGAIHRLRVEGKRLIYEEGGPRIGSNPQQVIVSPDGRYVCLPSGGGNGNVVGKPRAYTTFVYGVGDLQKTVMVIESGHYPRTLGFDVAARQIYAQNYDTPLIVFSPTGLKGKEYKIRDAGEPHTLLAHPGGKKVLFIGGPTYWIKLP
jgi:hypothetical protein